MNKIVYFNNILEKYFSCIYFEENIISDELDLISS